MNLYAAAEVGVIARSYPGSVGLHLNEDIAVYEPVDAGGLPWLPAPPRPSSSSPTSSTTCCRSFATSSPMN